MMRNFLVLCLALLLAGCAAEQPVTVLKLGHGLDPSHPVHQAMAFMAERLEEKSNGTVRLDVYPSQQLGTERECLELLQIGSLAVTKVSASVLENFAPSFQVLSLPFLFRSEAHQLAVLEGEIGQELLVQPAPYRLRGLTYYDAGSRSFYTVDRPVRRPEDLAGLKIRTQESQTAMRMVSRLGGSPTPIAWGELYTALQQGVVDGAENNPPSFYLSRHYEVARYYTLNEHTAVPDVLVISTLVWEDLTEQERQWVQEAASESAVYQRKLWKQATAEALQAVEAAGVEVIRFSEDDKAPFAERVAPMLGRYRGEVAALIERIQAEEG